MSTIAIDDIPDAIEIQEEYTNYQLINYEELRQELAETGVILKEDPIEGGLTKLNALIAQIDGQKTRISNIVNLSIKNESDLEILYKRVVGVYKREFDHILPNAGGPNAGAREAVCNSSLQELQALKLSIEGSYFQAKTFTKMVQNDLFKLDSTNKNISRQITVLQLANEIGEIQRGSTNPHTFK